MKAEAMAMFPDTCNTTEYKEYLDHYDEYFSLVGDENLVPLTTFLSNCIAYVLQEKDESHHPMNDAIVPEYQWFYFEDQWPHHQ
jgi:hypothetical protein